MVTFLHRNGWPTNNRPLSSVNAFNNHFTNTQLSVNSAAPVDEKIQADIDARLSDFIKAGIDNPTKFNIPLTTTRQVEENIKRIGGNKATGLDGFGINIIKLALPVISQSLANIYNTSINKAAFPNN